MKYETMHDLDILMLTKRATAKELARRSGYSASTIEHARIGRPVYRRTAAEIREALGRYTFMYQKPWNYKLKHKLTGVIP